MHKENRNFLGKFQFNFYLLRKFNFLAPYPMHQKQLFTPAFVLSKSVGPAELCTVSCLDSTGTLAVSVHFLAKTYLKHIHLHGKILKTVSNTH